MSSMMVAEEKYPHPTKTPLPRIKSCRSSVAKACEEGLVFGTNDSNHLGTTHMIFDEHATDAGSELAGIVVLVDGARYRCDDNENQWEERHCNRSMW